LVLRAGEGRRRGSEQRGAVEEYHELTFLPTRPYRVSFSISLRCLARSFSFRASSSNPRLIALALSAFAFSAAVASGRLPASIILSRSSVILPVLSGSPNFLSRAPPAMRRLAPPGNTSPRKSSATSRLTTCSRFTSAIFSSISAIAIRERVSADPFGCLSAESAFFVAAAFGPAADFLFDTGALAGSRGSSTAPARPPLIDRLKSLIGWGLP
jgi:hypothetical protein